MKSKKLISKILAVILSITTLGSALPAHAILPSLTPASAANWESKHNSEQLIELLKSSSPDYEKVKPIAEDSRTTLNGLLFGGRLVVDKKVNDYVDPAFLAVFYTRLLEFFSEHPTFLKCFNESKKGRLTITEHTTSFGFRVGMGNWLNGSEGEFTIFNTDITATDVIRVGFDFPRLGCRYPVYTYFTDFLIGTLIMNMYTDMRTARDITAKYGKERYLSMSNEEFLRHWGTHYGTLKTELVDEFKDTLKADWLPKLDTDLSIITLGRGQNAKQIQESFERCTFTEGKPLFVLPSANYEHCCIERYQKDEAFYELFAHVRFAENLRLHSQLLCSPFNVKESCLAPAMDKLINKMEKDLKDYYYE